MARRAVAAKRGNLRRIQNSRPKMRKFASTSSALPLRATTARSQTGVPSVRLVSRSVHTLPRLAYPVEDGVGKFLSPKALRAIAIEYQGGLLERLNELVKGTWHLLEAAGSALGLIFRIWPRYRTRQPECRYNCHQPSKGSRPGAGFQCCESST